MNMTTLASKAARIWMASRQLRLPISSLLLALLVSCATQLAPPYDKAVSDGLAAVNVEVMQLFATTSSGTQAATFTSREQSYNATIGKLDALVLQANARPAPDTRLIGTINSFLDKQGIPPVVEVNGEIPSAGALRKVSETVTKMRDTDRKQGVTAFESATFKQQASIYLDQALTYEAFLKR